MLASPHNTRPSWVTSARLAVLSPVRSDGTPDVPDGWPFVYPAALLRRTREVLAERENPEIRIPEDVQPLVDAVYDESFLDPARPMADDDIERLADEQVKSGLSQMAAIPR